MDIRVFKLRNHTVMLDSDLAVLYGVATGVFNQALKRNIHRFPEDFAFQLTIEDVMNLRSQNVISSLHGGRRYAPWVFTEHGAIMAASILGSERAVAMSVYVVRVFVRMRNELLANTALEARLQHIENTLLTQDTFLREIYDQIKPLLLPLPELPTKEIGFHTRPKDV